MNRAAFGTDFGFPTRPALTGDYPTSGWAKNFLSIGHSGAGQHAIPNTRTSLLMALQFNVDMIEIDVRPCKDSLVLLHANDLAYISPTAQGLASQVPLVQLSEIDLGEGEGILTLTEALELIKGRALINLDLKVRGCEAEVLRVVAHHKLMGDVLFSSVNTDSLQCVRQLAPAAITGLSFPEDKHNL